VDLGLGPDGAREIARSPGDLPWIAGEIISARIGLAVIAAVGVVAIAFMAAPSPAVTRFLLIYGVSLLGMPLLLQWVFQGFDEMGTVAPLELDPLERVRGVRVCFPCDDAAHAWLVPVAEVAGVVAAAVFCVVVYRRRFAVSPRPRWTVSRRLLREGGAIGLGQMFWAVRMYGGVVVLGWIASAADLGYFAAAQRILVAVHAFVYLYYFNLLPSMVAGVGRGRAAVLDADPPVDAAGSARSTDRRAGVGVARAGADAARVWQAVCAGDRKPAMACGGVRDCGYQWALSLWSHCSGAPITEMAIEAAAAVLRCRTDFRSDMGGWENGCGAGARHRGDVCVGGKLGPVLGE